MISPSTSPAQRLQLEEVLDLSAASALAKGLLALRGDDLSIDASQVRRLGAQALQVLASADATWAVDGKVFRFCAVSPEFAEGLRLLGMNSSFLVESH